jgi:aldose 1-epimerase
MFATENYSNNGFNLFALKDQSSNTYVEIIPSCGGILHSFNIRQGQSFLNVIEQYDNAADFAENVAGKGFKSCKLSPFACRIKDAAYTFNEKIYIIDKFLLGANALHGLLYDAVFTVIEQYAGAEHAFITIEYQYKGTDKGYPFNYDCRVSYCLKKNNELIISTSIINQHNKNILLQDGWHPYFTFGGNINELELEMQTLNRFTFDEGMIPTGETTGYTDFVTMKKIGLSRFDDCFSLDFAKPQPLCILRDAEKKIQVEIRPDNTYPYLQIYTPPQRNSIAIENLSAPPDTFNNKIGLVVLPPDAYKNFTTSFTIRSVS